MVIQSTDPVHFLITVWMHLDVFPSRWIGRGGPVAWPARSPDLNTLNFYLRVHLKGVVHTEPIPDVQTLEQHACCL
ncbi:hypothetical protein PR048_016601 [Dryococelus australis]|uniref:Uncharacterized protein n=1 Tax=Dryococelus australis TaxID=614101 RepID=A0ABQ9H791_9NEOP|nr:hypothetical protein PR048_016601 [Dryococelus australis]